MDERLADYVGGGWRTLEAAFARKHELWIRGEGSRPQWGGNTVVRVRTLIVHRDGGVCRMPLDDGRLCLAPATQVDHITPRSEGGPLFDPANLRAACMPCNLYAGHMLAASKFGPLRGGVGVAPPQNAPWFLGALG
jgi:5-methylcytosine-specific restriction endonuclease McrA